MNWQTAYDRIGMTEEDIHLWRVIIDRERWDHMCNIAYASDLVEFEQANPIHPYIVQDAVNRGERRELISGEDVCIWHGQMFPDKDWSGDWRQRNVYIRGASVDLPHWHLVPSLMRHFMEDLEWWLVDSGESEWTILAHLHMDFVRIHPFDDGNGRIGRVLLNYCAAYLELPCIKIDLNSRDEYIDILEARDENLLADFLYSKSMEC